MPNKPAIPLKLILSLLLLSAFNSAVASAVYSVHMKKKLNGAKIFAQINKVNAPGTLTVLKLSNFDTRAVECKASFDPRIEQKKSFKRRLKPNTHVSIRYTTSRPPNRIHIELKCRPIENQLVTDTKAAATGE